MIGPWEIHAAITTYVAGGFLTVQCKSYGDDGNMGFFVAHHPYGFRGTPLDGDQNGESGAQSLIGFEGDRGHAWVLEDGRLLPKLPSEGTGGSLQYATTSDGKISYCMLNGSDGSATVHVDDDGGPIRLEHGNTGPSLEVNEDTVDVGGVPDGGAVLDDGSFLAWVQAISAATNVAPPAAFTSTKVRIKR